jgi:NDP-sugar pyrophosphorylase family protein
MDVEDVRCFIPVGGQAKRLRPLTSDISKPCIRFLNRPLIEFSMASLAEQGVRNFIFGEYGFTNYTNLFDQFGEGVGFSAKYQIEPRVHIKHQPNLDDKGSADSYRLNMQYYDIKSPVLVVQGDNLFELDLKDLIRRHEESGALMTIALTRVEQPEQFGIADLGENARIQRFVEKPKLPNSPGNLANAGIYLLSPEVRKIVESNEVRDLIRQRNRLDFGFDFIPYLVENRFPVFGYELKVWYDVGSPERYLTAMRDTLHGKLNIRVREERIFPGRNIWVQGYSRESIERRKEIIRKCNEGRLTVNGAALFGRHTRVGDYSNVSDSNIDNFCNLGQNVTIDRSAIMDAARVGDYARVSQSIVGRMAVIDSTQENPTRIESNSVLGNGVHIMSSCALIETKVNPGLSIAQGMTYRGKFLETFEDVARLAE